ncbi:hypothetical protein [Sphingosinicella rhizophila]|uniref:Bacteriophage Rz lysis protein n=1 Tax=Sphingosinicella rhizophila TaxID=3050082 RepID=A0ABU3QAB6_9SPHN|nr:hypothetical protein [Sphingosinicella sp. GR2756]MDT9600301.1 hypothetical protein [Sphingosinicella sp. GR2756]
MIERIFAPAAMKIAAGLQLLSLAAIAFLWLANAGEAHRADKWQANARAEAAAHRLSIAEVERVRADQQAKDIEHVRQVEQAQVRISEEVSNEYQHALADLRRRYDSVRLQFGTSAIDQGDRRGSDLPNVSKAASGSYETAPLGDNVFNCEANTIQLQSLIDWVNNQIDLPQ